MIIGKFTRATLLMSALLLSFNAWGKSAYSGYTDQAAKNLYGSGASYSWDCAGCHGTSGSHDILAAGTGFGKDIRTEALARGFPTTSLTAAQMQTIIQAIASKDSDTDRATNAQELTAGTNPGDSGSVPISCVRANPRLSLSPTSQSGLAGASLNYTLAVTNSDSSGCAASTFSLSDSVPAGLAASLSMSSVVLNPAQSINVTVSVSSLSGTAAGNYIFSVTASNGGATSFQAVVTGTYVVQAPPPPAVCVRAAPILSITPASLSDYAGNTLTYQLSLSNRDSIECAASSFSLSASLPAGWSSQFSSASLALNPGQSMNANIMVTSPLAAAPASYNFSVSASDGLAGHSGQGSAAYVVMGPADVSAPTAPADVTATIVKRKWQISWTASTDNIGVVRYSVYVDGVLKADTTQTTAALRLRRGVHSITVTAWDAAGNQSDPSLSIQVGQ